MIDIAEILKLPTSEKLQLMEIIEDSIDSDKPDSDFTEDQKLDILKRLEDFERGRSTTNTWDEVKSFARSGS